MDFSQLEKALADPSTTVVAQIAPAVRVSLGECFGFESGTPMAHKVVGALRKLGFDFVFDTSFGADVVVAEETAELEERLEKGGPFPLINSCCSGTVVFLEHAYPDLTDLMASAKSPMEVTGVLIKTYFAKERGLKDEDIFSVAVMPCVIKKAEAQRHDMLLEGRQVVDLVLTTMELAEFMKSKGVSLRDCEDADFDPLLGTASGGGQIFGSTGGISEAALRNYAFKHGVPLEKIETGALRSGEGTREIVFSLDGKEVKTLVINCLRNASPVLNDKEKIRQYAFIEIMACHGGCVGGAGQPPSTQDVIEKRRKGLYAIDANLQIKAAEQNPEIRKLYSDFLGEPRSLKSRALLHTSFTKICHDCF